MDRDSVSGIATLVLAQAQVRAEEGGSQNNICRLMQIEPFFSRINGLHLPEYFYVDAQRANRELDPEQAEYLKYRIGFPIWPIGRCARDHTLLVMSSTGRVYAETYGVLWYYGDSAVESINHVCREVVRSYQITGLPVHLPSILADYPRLTPIAEVDDKSTDQLSFIKTLLHHPDSQVLFDAARIISWLAPTDHEVFKSLLALAHTHTGSDVRRVCLGASLNIINRFIDNGIQEELASFLDVLIGLISDRGIDEECRHIACLAIAAMGPVAAPSAPHLFQLIENEHETVLFRCQLAVTLGCILTGTPLASATFHIVDSFPDELKRAITMTQEDLGII